MSAIRVKNLSFSYGLNLILNDFCAEIKFNQIYALLGPSGGGKTTLLRLILGRMRVQNGSISVLGEKPGLANNMISYMPQDCALCQHFTVDQTLYYFMNIYRIPREEFRNRYNKLKSLLNLPEGNLSVIQLSGGTQRRLSIAVALINNPSLVILDEPTAGIDAILRNQIWDYLVNQCKNGLTVVIVTHYIEEAANANRVGLMRNGKLLAEDNPKEMIQKYNQNNLEDVFLKLCLMEDKSFSKQEKYESNVKYNNKTFVEKYDDHNYVSKRESNDNNWTLKIWILLILIHKNILKFFHMGVSLLIVLLPATQALLFCAVYSKDLIEIKAAVYNEEPTPMYGQQLISSIVSNKRHIITPVNYSSLKSAIKAVENREAIGAIRVPINYSEALDERIESGLNSDNQTIIDSTLYIYIDNSVLMYGNGFIDSLTDTYMKFMSNLYKEKNITGIQTPIAIETTEFTENLRINDYYMPGYFLFYLFMSQITLSSLLLTQERKDGLFERSLVAGVSHELVFISHFITSCLLSALQILFLYLSGFVLFKSPNHGSLALTLGFFMTEAINSISLGLLISSVIDREITCLILVWFISLPQLFTTGIFWPLESVEKVMKLVLYFCPLSIPVETMRSIMLRGWHLSNIYIQFGFLSAIIPSILYLSLALAIFKRK